MRGIRSRIKALLGRASAPAPPQPRATPDWLDQGPRTDFTPDDRGVAEGVDADAVDLALLTDEIVRTHHAFVRTETPRIDALVRRASPDLQAAWRELSSMLLDHIGKEETILFPMLAAVQRGDRGAVVDCIGPMRGMEAEHDGMRAMEAAVLHELGRADPACREAVLAWLEDLRVHAEVEEGSLFPVVRDRVRKALAQADAGLKAPTKGR